MTPGPGQAQDFFAGAEHSRGGRTVFALPSRNLNGQSNILLSVEDFPNQFTNRESLDLIITEYGIASMIGRTVRERAQALIDIAHPDHRAGLIARRKGQISSMRTRFIFPTRVRSTRTRLPLRTPSTKG